MPEQVGPEEALVIRVLNVELLPVFGDRHIQRRKSADVLHRPTLDIGIDPHRVQEIEKDVGLRPAPVFGAVERRPEVDQRPLPGGRPGEPEEVHPPRRRPAHRLDRRPEIGHPERVRGKDDIVGKIEVRLRVDLLPPSRDNGDVRDPLVGDHLLHHGNHPCRRFDGGHMGHGGGEGYRKRSGARPHVEKARLGGEGETGKDLPDPFGVLPRLLQKFTRPLLRRPDCCAFLGAVASAALLVLVCPDLVPVYRDPWLHCTFH